VFVPVQVYKLQLCCVLLLCRQVWRHSSFSQRRQLLKVLLKYIISHQQEICR